MTKLRMTYRDAIIWLVSNDDNHYLIDAVSHFEFVPLSATASAVADLYRKDDCIVLRDLRAALGLRKPRWADMPSNINAN